MSITQFPLDRVRYSVDSYRPEGATIIVLPMLRIERIVDPDPLIRTFAAAVAPAFLIGEGELFL